MEGIPLDVKSSQIQIIPEAICSVLNVVLPFATSSFAAEPGFMSSFYSICPENLNHSTKIVS